MPGKYVTKPQEKIYMSARNEGHTQVTSAAKAGISERTGRKIDQGTHGQDERPRHWRTREDPLAQVWDSELAPLLASEPELQPITLLEYLQDKYKGKYPDSILRTLQRRVKQWSALEGPEKTVIFRQEHPPGRLGLSDFTTLKDVAITIQGEPLRHLLYHFRLACSGWSHIKAVLGGESFTALAEGLQEALWRLGGAPLEHRTDSLSAAFKNLTSAECDDMTERYDELCKNYQMKATRNNRGVSHENGSIESPHGHVKRRIKQALLLREGSDFESLEMYQEWLNGVVNQHNKRNAKTFNAERAHLQPLPSVKSADYTELCVRVTSSSTIDVRRTTYTVPSRLEGESLRIKLYHDRLQCYLGTTHVISLTRVYPTGKASRARQVDYRHIIHSLMKKPAAFRYSQLREDILPNDQYKRIWHYVDQELSGKACCKYIVKSLYLAAVYDCERPLADAVLSSIEQGHLLSVVELEKRFGKPADPLPDVEVEQHSLAIYDNLLNNAAKEVSYG